MPELKLSKPSPPELDRRKIVHRILKPEEFEQQWDSAKIAFQYDPIWTAIKGGFHPPKLPKGLTARATGPNGERYVFSCNMTGLIQYAVLPA